MNAKHPSIVNADGIDVVWGRFIDFLDRHIDQTERGIIVAWNGASCDLEWLYRLTQRPTSTLLLPERVEYFFDPYHGIKNTTGCKLSKKHVKSTLYSYSLGSVYEKVTGKSLEDAHCSLADAKAQLQVVMSSEF